VRDFKAPLIAGSMTTLVVFIPMMVLPGITGKFLAYIPITVFITLVAALAISLTLNSALFYKLSKPKTRYLREENVEKFLTASDREILEKEREGKEARDHEEKSLRQRLLDGLSRLYDLLCFLDEINESSRSR
jgi:multidrug efflux pump subunit AcrB